MLAHAKQAFLHCWNGFKRIERSKIILQLFRWY